jgi:hypothetical protein
MAAAVLQPAMEVVEEEGRHRTTTVEAQQPTTAAEERLTTAEAVTPEEAIPRRQQHRLALSSQLPKQRQMIQARQQLEPLRPSSRLQQRAQWSMSQQLMRRARK